jgi:hypothetical protein
MRSRTWLFLGIAATLSCSGSEPTAADVKPSFVDDGICSVAPLITPPGKAFRLPNTSSTAVFRVKNYCASTPTLTYTATSGRTGSVASVATPVPAGVSLDGGEVMNVSVPYTTGAPGTGTVRLSLSRTGSSRSATATIIVGSP